MNDFIYKYLVETLILQINLCDILEKWQMARKKDPYFEKGSFTKNVAYYKHGNCKDIFLGLPPPAPL